MYICKFAYRILSQSLTVIVSAVTLLAATTQPVWRPELKYSIVYPMSGEAPGLLLVASCHETVTDDWVVFRMRGCGGALGYVDGSGMRCTFGAAVFSTVREADHEVSPLSELAVHVYSPESVSWRSKNTAIHEISSHGKGSPVNTWQCSKSST
jgi:hypothetical protein